MKIPKSHYNLNVNGLGQGNTNCTFAGFLSQKENHTYYCQFKTYISIPQIDSVSISLVEAMLCDCVPFVSNLEASLELMEDDKNAFIENIHFEKWEQVDSEYLMKTKEKLKVNLLKAYNSKPLYNNL